MVAPGNLTITGSYTYTMKDNAILFHPDCVILALTTTCGTAPVGTFVGTHLVIDISGAGNGPVYDYQLGVSE